jgi:hypothetical protein
MNVPSVKPERQELIARSVTERPDMSVAEKLDEMTGGRSLNTYAYLSQHAAQKLKKIHLNES